MRIINQLKTNGYNNQFYKFPIRRTLEIIKAKVNRKIFIYQFTT